MTGPWAAVPVCNARSWVSGKLSARRFNETRVYDRIRSPTFFFCPRSLQHRTELALKTVTMVASETKTKMTYVNLGTIRCPP
jgi:hypothetical protein